MKKLYLLPYKKGSLSGISLAKALKSKRIKLENSLYKKKPTHLVINWGNSKAPNFVDFNKANAVALAANKLKTFEKLKEANLSHPEWTTDKNVAKNWLDKDEVLCRHKLTAHSGQGIEEFNGSQDAPLYVKYVKKMYEYRVHVFKNTIIDIQQKKKRAGGDANAKVRNLANGWVYTRNDIIPVKEAGLKLALDSIKALNLDFGAIDMVYNQKKDTYYILEVNTAPGLVGTTLTKYTEAFLNAAK
jgi:glutathione synthase/RimK-type ligase-like ATP-grasp enzyme